MVTHSKVVDRRFKESLCRDLPKPMSMKKPVLFADAYGTSDSNGAEENFSCFRMATQFTDETA